MRKQTAVSWGWLSLPFLIALLGGVLEWANWNVVWGTLAGALAVLIGGLAAGVTVRRYLSDETPTPHIVFGMGAAGVIGTVALGYVYIFFLCYPMASIQTSARVLSQSVVFGTFFLAQYIGVFTLYPFLAEKLKWENL